MMIEIQLNAIKQCTKQTVCWNNHINNNSELKAWFICHSDTHECCVRYYPRFSYAPWYFKRINEVTSDKLYAISERFSL